MFQEQIVRYRPVFNRKKELNKRGEAVVQIRAYLNGNPRYFKTGIYLTPDQWNEKKGEPKDPYKANQIRKYIVELTEFENQARFQNQGKFSLEDFDPFLNPAKPLDPQPQKQTFNQFFLAQIKARDKELKWNTYRQQMACLNLVNEFNPSITFEDLKYKVLDDLHRYMVSKGHCNSTSNKRHKIIRAYISKAIKLEILSKNPYDNFKIPTPVVNKMALLGSELKALEGLKFLLPNNRPERVRDMFLFATYTGLRWGDVSVLTRQNLIKTDDGIILNIKAAKTDKVFQLPLWIMFESKAQDLALKYWPCEESGKLFPNLNNAYANRTLKKLAISANIKKQVTFHVSRHTTATILAQKAGVLTAKDVLQHATLATTMAYLHLSNSERNKSLSSVENWY